MTVHSDYAVVRDSLVQPAAFGVVFDRHARAVHRYLRRRVGEDIASDLTSEVFTRAFRDRSRLDDRSESALPWLLGIATNLVKMHRRAEKRRLHAYARSGAHGGGGVSMEGAEARVDAAAVASVLAEALAAMPARQRDVLLLHAWAGLSLTEIALALALPPSTVRSHLHRARGFAEARLAAHAPHVVLDREQAT